MKGRDCVAFPSNDAMLIQFPRKGLVSVLCMNVKMNHFEQQVELVRLQDQVPRVNSEGNLVVQYFYIAREAHIRTTASTQQQGHNLSSQCSGMVVSPHKDKKMSQQSRITFEYIEEGISRTCSKMIKCVN